MSAMVLAVCCSRTSSRQCCTTAISCNQSQLSIASSRPIRTEYSELSANHSSVFRSSRPITAQYSELSTNQRGVLPSHLDQQLVGHVVEEAVRGEENHVPVLHAELVLVRGLGPGHNQSEVSIMSSNDQSEVSIESLPVGQDFALKLSGRKRELEGSVEVVLLLVRSKHVFHVKKTLSPI